MSILYITNTASPNSTDKPTQCAGMSHSIT